MILKPNWCVKDMQAIVSALLNDIETWDGKIQAAQAEIEEWKARRKIAMIALAKTGYSE